MMRSELVPSHVQNARHRYLFTTNLIDPSVLGEHGAVIVAHDKQECLIVREVGPDEVDLDEVGRMFRIRFDDGTETDAFVDELLCLHDGEEDASDCIIGGAKR